MIISIKVDDSQSLRPTYLATGEAPNGDDHDEGGFDVDEVSVAQKDEA